MRKRGGSVQVTQRQWIQQDLTFNVTSGVPAIANLSFGDVEGGLVPRGSLCRVIGDASIYCENLTGAAGTFHFLGLGLMLCDPELGNTITPMGTDDADRPWVYRTMYRLPKPPPAVAFSGLVDLNGEPYHFDWGIRGGRGSSPQKDSLFRFVSAATFSSATLVVLHLKTLQLWEN